jgi:hypothetical protein
VGDQDMIPFGLALFFQAATTFQTGTLWEPVSGNVAAGVPVARVACGYGEACVATQNGSGGISGVSLESGTDGAFIHILPQGRTMCIFSNQPVMNDGVMAVDGMCVDTPLVKSKVSNLQGYVGKVLRVIDSTHAEVNVTGPGVMGDMVVGASMDPDTMPDYIKANQLTSAGPTGATGDKGDQGIQGIPGQSITGTAATVTVGTVTNLGCTATPTVANAGTLSAAVFNFGIPVCKNLTGTTASIGGTLLAIGGYASGVATVTGAIVGKPCFASPADGVKISGIAIDCAVTATNTVTVYLTGIIAVLPTGKAYNVSVTNY